MKKKGNTEFKDELSKEIFEATYLYENEKDVNDRHLAIAKDLSQNEKDKEKWTIKFKEILEDFKFCPGGRITSNAGTGLKGTTYINCFVSGFDGEDKDSMDGIMDELRRQAKILKSEGGYGFCVNTLRPRGAFINGIGSDSPGAVKMLEMWDTQSSVITEGSGIKRKDGRGKKKIRKGAQMVTMSDWHPDIEEFIISKQTPGRLTKFNMSVLISDKFMDCVENNKPWILEFPDYEKHPEEYKKEWDGNIEKWKDKKLSTIVYKEFENANELWDLIMKSTYNRNEPGVLFVDTINRMNNLYYKEYIDATNPCLVGDTEVLLANGDGYKKIKDLAEAGRDVDVFCLNEKNEIVIRKMVNPRITGKNKPVYKVTFDDGSEIVATENHKFLLKDGNFKELRDLKVGDSFEIATLFKKENNSIDMRINNNLKNFEINKNNSVIKKNLSEKLNEKKCKKCGSIFLLSYEEREYSFCSNNCSEKYHDILNKERAKRSLKSINENAEVKIYSDIKFRIERDLSLKEWNDYCKRINLNTKNDLNEIKDMAKFYNHRVASIEFYGYQDVYNGTVDEYHNFLIGGLEEEKYRPNFISKNCGEQVLPKGGSCLLGSINLTQFVDIENKNWDYKKLEEIIPIAVRMMDNVNDISNVPLPKQKEELLNKRRIGLGYLGYGSALIMMKVRYGSSQALKLTEELCDFVMNKAYQSSSLIAKEKGSFKFFDKDKYLKSNFVKGLNSKTKKMIKENGMRNSHLLSIQPTGNTSIMANNCSGGLEPVFSLEYIRTSIQPSAPENLGVPVNVDWANKKYGVKGADTTWEWAKEGDEDILVTIFEGKKWKFDKSRGLLKESKVKDYSLRFHEENNTWKSNAKWAATAFDLNIDDHVKTMKVFSKYVDSAMSKTVNLPGDYSFEDFKSLYKDVHKTGTIKGCTSYREGTMTSVLSTESTSAEKKGVPKSNAPKRPSSLPCDIHHVQAEGTKWIVFVGLYENEPYEIFAFKQNRISIPSRVNNGTLTKIKGKYKLELDDGWGIEDIHNFFESNEQEALTRMISTALRHGANIEFVTVQLQKSEGTIVSFSKAIARTLKKYIKDVKTMKCSECGSKNIKMQEGCFVCSDCGSSKCE